MDTPFRLRPSAFLHLAILAALGSLTFLAAVLLRIDLDLSSALWPVVLSWLPAVFVVRLASFAAFGGQRWIWRSVTLHDLLLTGGVSEATPHEKLLRVHEPSGDPVITRVRALLGELPVLDAVGARERLFALLDRPGEHLGLDGRGRGRHGGGRRCRQAGSAGCGASPVVPRIPHRSETPSRGRGILPRFVCPPFHSCAR